MIIKMFSGLLIALTPIMRDIIGDEDAVKWMDGLKHLFFEYIIGTRDYKAIMQAARLKYFFIPYGATHFETAIGTGNPKIVLALLRGGIPLKVKPARPRTLYEVSDSNNSNNNRNYSNSNNNERNVVNRLLGMDSLSSWAPRDKALRKAIIDELVKQYPSLQRRLLHHRPRKD